MFGKKIQRNVESLKGRGFCVLVIVFPKEGRRPQSVGGGIGDFVGILQHIWAPSGGGNEGTSFPLKCKEMFNKLSSYAANQPRATFRCECFGK